MFFWRKTKLYSVEVPLGPLVALVVGALVVAVLAVLGWPG